MVLVIISFFILKDMECGCGYNEVDIFLSLVLMKTEMSFWHLRIYNHHCNKTVKMCVCKEYGDKDTEIENKLDIFNDTVQKSKHNVFKVAYNTHAHATVR